MTDIQSPTSTSSTSPAALPAPLIRPKPRGLVRLLPWLIPAAALALAAVLVGQSLASRGPRLWLTFDNGHGVKPGDPVVHRGVQAGRVRTVGFGPSGEVRIGVELSRNSSFLAKTGRFWVVRPELSLSRVSGIETIMGPRYIAADSGRGLPGNRGRITLSGPPTDSPSEGLHLTIRALRASSLSPGSPVSYREMHVGEVTSVALASDAKSIEIAVRIDTEHAHLVRPTTRFWNVSGIGLDLGLVGGIKLKAESLQTILSGGLAFATPEKPAPGEPVPDGHEFVMGEFEEDYLKWVPDLSKTEP